MREWPKWMPRPDQEGYSYEPVDRRTKTDMEIGGVYRVEFDTDEGRVSCRITCDQLQSAYLEKLERDYLNQGSIWFKFPLWFGGNLVESEVRFAERPKLASNEAAYSSYTLTLDVKARGTIMCNQAFEALECLTPDELAALHDEFGSLVNEALAGTTIFPDLPAPPDQE